MTETDFKTACGRWPEYPNKWTPVGWRDHMHRFNVLWNGTIVAEPALNRRTAQWAGQGVQACIMPSREGRMPIPCSVGYACRRVDDGMIRQGWLNEDVPVLWTEWFEDGVVLRSEVFAHVPGGGPTQRGDEPLFAWVRLRIHDLCRPLPIDPEHGFLISLQDFHLLPSMNTRDFMAYQGWKVSPMTHQGVDRHYPPTSTAPGDHPYPRELRADDVAPSAAGGCRVLEPDGRVRVAAVPRRGCRLIRLLPPDEQAGFHRVDVRLQAREGSFADVLLPLVPCDRATFDRELALGYDAARREANRFWKQQLRTATRFVTPEADVNDALRQNVRFHLNLSEKNPATGKYCKITGSWIYANLWTTPFALDVMLLDTLGYHADVRRYLDIFKAEQGTVVPPGDGYELHPGYYSTPELYKSVDWLSDNGAVLWTICRHALLSGDEAFAREFAESIIKSCEWIRDNRARTDHGGYKGVLPPGIATDKWTKIQAVWSAGWNHLGLTAAVQVLRQLRHPRAAEFAAEANAYREDYVKALRDKCRQMPTWQDSRGRTRRFVPTALYGDQPDESRHAFYLDGGPLFHVFSGLLPASDPLMQDCLAWFREGPQVRHVRRDSNCWQVPYLDHEISSCEPCYSWNIFHSWQLGDRPKFLEGMYSLFAGMLSQQTRVGCETRGGISALVSGGMPVYLARLAVIDDVLAPDELHLLRLVPAAWLKRSEFVAVPTIFGPVTLRTKVSKDGKTLDVTYTAKFRHPPKKVVLHVPAIRTVRVNGKKVNPKKGQVAL